MSSPPSRYVVLAVVAVSTVGLRAPVADASLASLRPKPVTAAPAVIPVAAQLSVDPLRVPARGTLIMLHGSGWAGHDPDAQHQLIDRPGDLFVQRGWRVVSIDYDEGADGLQYVLNAAGDELIRQTGDGPLCVYGESSGAHLALIAASRLRAIDCVVGLGTPTDLLRYQIEGAASTDFRVRLVASQIRRLFGTTPVELARWDLVSLAPAIHADVLLITEADDELVPLSHTARFKDVRPTTQTVELQAGDRTDGPTRFVHGTVSEVGRARYASALASFADRAVVAREAQRKATRTGCARTNRSIRQIGLARLRNALRCLARSDARSLRAARANWRRKSVTLRGEVTAARLWAHLRTTRSGRRALAAAAKRHANITVRSSGRSRITLRRRPTR